jgi:hypothetical protein
VYRITDNCTTGVGSMWKHCRYKLVYRRIVGLVLQPCLTAIKIQRE